MTTPSEPQGGGRHPDTTVQSANATCLHGDCLTLIPTLAGELDLIYLDPPFATGSAQRLTSRDGERSHTYGDRWSSMDAYFAYMRSRLGVARDALSEGGSLLYHCDRRTSHHARTLLGGLFGEANFRAEIIWTYRRWSNTRRGLVPAHQTLFWFSKGSNFIFNRIYDGYSPTTNVDQLLQRRTRDGRDKSVYATDINGVPLPSGDKPGVPLSDVWDIPYLNPKAKERVGYPTQKPVALLDRVVRLWTDADSVVLDPFCGSGTTLLAAQRLGRTCVGIDVSADAVALTRARLANPVITESRVLRLGRSAYEQADPARLALLDGLATTAVQRNRFVDAVLAEGVAGRPVLVRVQRAGERLGDLCAGLERAAQRKNAALAVLVQTCEADGVLDDVDRRSNSRVEVVFAPAVHVRRALAAAGALLGDEDD